MMFSDHIQQLRTYFLRELQDVLSTKDLENIKIKYLGKKGAVQALMQDLKNCTAEERPHFGKLVNELKEEFSAHYDHTMERLRGQEMAEAFQKEVVDVALPGRRRFYGKKHPIQQMLDRIIDILVGMGFSVQYGPDVDTDYYNFEGLNFAADHPARDMQDTFYLGNDLLLRTHTSNVQVHALETFSPPLRIVAPGRVFRNEDISARSHVVFHQVEAFYIDKNVTFSDLLSTMDEFLHKLFSRKVDVRFRPSYFPFVEPGMEVDVRCTACKGNGCRICKHTGWLEILGAGMVHPNVLKKGNVDPEVYSGYAWGLGIERLALLEWDIPDLRLFTENDMRFLSQFA